MKPLADRLSARRLLVLDGAVGTELDRRGVATTLPLWSALGLIDAPDVVRSIHRDYAAAGADVMITNTFRTTPRTLVKGGLAPSEARRLDALAVELARAGAADAGVDVLVAGSLAPLEDCYSPELYPGDLAGLREHRAHAESLAAAGVDFLMVETMPLLAEAVTAVRAALSTGLEVTVGFVTVEGGDLISGESLTEAARQMEQLGVSAVFVNCVAPAEVTAGVRALRDAVTVPVGGYANLGDVESTVGWEADTSTDGRAYAAGAEAWLAAGAVMIGGCCGTTPEHVAALRPLVDRWRRELASR